MNNRFKNMAKAIAKIGAIVGFAGGTHVLTELFLGGGKLPSEEDNNSDKDTVKMPDISEEAEKFNEDEVIVEDVKEETESE